MARKPRTDLEPLFWLDDDAEDRRRFNKHSNRKAKKIYFEGIGPKEDFSYKSVTLNDNYRWHLIRNRQLQEKDWLAQGIKYRALDIKLLCFVMDHCAFATKKEVTDPKTRAPIKQDGKGLYKFQSVGCRVQMTHEHISCLFGCSREHVTKQMLLLYELGIIVNRGEGWQEFDADLCWKGSWELWRAYRKVQKGNMDVVFMLPDNTEHRVRNLLRDLDFKPDLPASCLTDEAGIEGNKDKAQKRYRKKAVRK